jgi:hypothetical protein
MYVINSVQQLVTRNKGGIFLAHEKERTLGCVTFNLTGGAVLQLRESAKPSEPIIARHTESLTMECNYLRHLCTHYYAHYSTLLATSTCSAFVNQ